MDNDKIEEARKQRNRAKQQAKREELKELEKAKMTVDYQRMINANRVNFGLDKKKVQKPINSFFK